VQSKVATEYLRQRQVWIPIGLLFLVKIGDIWKNGKRIHTPHYQKESFEQLDIQRESTAYSGENRHL
jgi:hypothetical protein